MDPDPTISHHDMHAWSMSLNLNEKHPRVYVDRIDIVINNSFNLDHLIEECNKNWIGSKIDRLYFLF